MAHNIVDGYCTVCNQSHGSIVTTGLPCIQVYDSPGEVKPDAVVIPGEPVKIVSPMIPDPAPKPPVKQYTVQPGSLRILNAWAPGYPAKDRHAIVINGPLAATGLLSDNMPVHPEKVDYGPSPLKMFRVDIHPSHKMNPVTGHCDYCGLIGTADETVSFCTAAANNPFAAYMRRKLESIRQRIADLILDAKADGWTPTTLPAPSQPGKIAAPWQIRPRQPGEHPDSAVAIEDAFGRLVGTAKTPELARLIIEAVHFAQVGK